jgi:RNA polymerase sigma factor (sigma-70 family)
VNETLSDDARELTAAIASGDTEAFSRFYQQWFDFACREARKVSRRDEQFCLDIVQETMMRVIRSIKPMDSEPAVERWLNMVIRSRCIDRIRRDCRRSRREFAHGVDNGTVDAAAASELSEQELWLHEQLASLDAEQIQLLDLRFRLGWTLQRIGRFLGMKPGAVDGRISRSLAALREVAQEELND